MNVLKRLFSTLVLASFAFAALAGTTDQLREEIILDILRECHVPFSANAVSQSVVEGMLKAVDPEAVILPTGSCPRDDATQSIALEEHWGGILYLKPTGLDENTGRDITERLRVLGETNCLGVIIDMRGAGGGNLAAVDRIAGMITPADTVLYHVRNGLGEDVETHMAERPLLPIGEGRLMLLIDDRTHGASEVLAASLSAQAGVLLVGSRTSGDAARRRTIPVSDRESLRIATHWIDPADSPPYDMIGVRPDIVVDIRQIPGGAEASSTEDFSKRSMSDKAELDRQLMLRVSGDAVLSRATDVLLGLEALSGLRDR